MNIIREQLKDLSYSCFYGFPKEYEKVEPHIDELLFHIEDRFINIDVKQLSEENIRLEEQVNLLKSKLNEIEAIVLRSKL